MPPSYRAACTLFRTPIRAEVHLFGERAGDRRLRWVEEVSRLTEGDPGSADIASAR